MVSDLLLYNSLSCVWRLHEKMFFQNVRLFRNAGWKWGAVTQRFPCGYYFIMGNTRKEVMQKLDHPCVQSISIVYIAPLSRVIKHNRK